MICARCRCEFVGPAYRARGEVFCSYECCWTPYLPLPSEIAAATAELRSKHLAQLRAASPRHDAVVCELPKAFSGQRRRPSTIAEMSI